MCVYMCGGDKCTERERGERQRERERDSALYKGPSMLAFFLAQHFAARWRGPRLLILSRANSGTSSNDL